MNHESISGGSNQLPFNLELSREEAEGAWNELAAALVIHGEHPQPVRYGEAAEDDGTQPYEFSYTIPNSFAKDALMDEGSTGAVIEASAQYQMRHRVDTESGGSALYESFENLSITWVAKLDPVRIDSIKVYNRISFSKRYIGDNVVLNAYASREYTEVDAEGNEKGINLNPIPHHYPDSVDDVTFDDIERAWNDAEMGEREIGKLEIEKMQTVAKWIEQHPRTLEKVGDF